MYFLSDIRIGVVLEDQQEIRSHGLCIATKGRAGFHRHAHPSFFRRSRAAYALGQIGGAPEEVVPALVQSLSNHIDILISLGKYGADAGPAVPTIVALLDGIERSANAHNLSGSDRNVLCEAARALYQIAPPEAEKRLPLLRQVLQQEEDPFWRSRLAKVINTISSGASPNDQEK